jgi:hypothetical protein
MGSVNQMITRSGGWSSTELGDGLARARLAWAKTGGAGANREPAANPVIMTTAAAREMDPEALVT